MSAALPDRTAERAAVHHALQDLRAQLHTVPEHMHAAIEGWVVHGWKPGPFLTAVLSNDLSQAALRADDQNALALRAWVRLLYYAAPVGSHGSPDKVEAWIKAGGVAGRAGRAS